MNKRLLSIIRKEFIHLWRDPRSLALMILLPVFLLFIYGYAVSLDVNNIPTALLDQDRTPASRDFISKFVNTGYFQLEEYLGSESQFTDCLDSGRVKVIFNIPSGFSKKIKKSEQAQVQVLVDGSDPTWASSALAYISGIAQTYEQGLVKIAFEKMGLREGLKPPIDLVSRIWYNETLRSINFYVPGLICVILMQISATLTSLTIVSEKEQGTMESLVVSPLRRNELMLGKLIPYVLVAFADVLIITALAVFWFGVPFKGSFLLLVLSSLIFLTGAISIGVLISTNAKSSQEAMQLATLATMLPALLLSGFIFPIENMPWILQGISFFVPARYYLDILRGIFLKGVGMGCLWLEFLLMTVFSVLVIYASVTRFKKRIE
jgi:ABC-2 type transport system permease protein